MAYLALRQSKLSRSRRSNLDYAAKLFKCACRPVCSPDAVTAPAACSIDQTYGCQ